MNDSSFFSYLLNNLNKSNSPLFQGGIYNPAGNIEFPDYSQIDTELLDALEENKIEKGQEEGTGEEGTGGTSDSRREEGTEGTEGTGEGTEGTGEGTGGTGEGAGEVDSGTGDISNLDTIADLPFRKMNPITGYEIKKVPESSPIPNVEQDMTRRMEQDFLEQDRPVRPEVPLPDVDDEDFYMKDLIIPPETEFDDFSEWEKPLPLSPPRPNVPTAMDDDIDMSDLQIEEPEFDDFGEWEKPLPLSPPRPNVPLPQVDDDIDMWDLQIEEPKFDDFSEWEKPLPDLNSESVTVDALPYYENNIPITTSGKDENPEVAKRKRQNKEQEELIRRNLEKYGIDLPYTAWGKWDYDYPDLNSESVTVDALPYEK